MACHSGKLTNNLVRVTVKGQRNREGKPLRTDFGLGGVDIVTLNQARVSALWRDRKAELIWRHLWQIRRNAEIAIFEYINGSYTPPDADIRH